MKRLSRAVDEEERAAVVPSPPTTKPCWKTTTTNRGVAVVIGTLVCLVFLVGTRWIDHNAAFYWFQSATGVGSFSWRGEAPGRSRSSTTPLIPIPFSCGNETSTTTALCGRRASTPAPSPLSSPPKHELKQYASSSPPPLCPDYFRHIHTDLEPWRSPRGITPDMVERARRHADYRLVVVAGRAYLETYRGAVLLENRDTFTQWGILQLLARYPGRVPDVDIMFSRADMPDVLVKHYRDPSTSPPLFQYAKDEKHLGILWPDWSFWGWPDTNIRPWAPLMEKFVRENARLRWPDREPYAFWKGNPAMSPLRRDLFKCDNDSAANMRVFKQDWAAATRSGFKDSNLAKQCQYRYKIYVQGGSWSVSKKYILACDSPMLAIDTPFDDFFSRGLVAGKHYWPIDAVNKCRAIKSAVDWGNANPVQARRIGEEGSRFARKDMDMDYVYDYMLHVLTQYAALLRYKPTVPEKAVEICPESMACPRNNREREFLMESREQYVAGYEPCTLPPPFNPEEAREMAAREESVRSEAVKMAGI